MIRLFRLKNAKHAANKTQLGPNQLVAKRDVPLPVRKNHPDLTRSHSHVTSRQNSKTPYKQNLRKELLITNHRIHSYLVDVH
jgi:hypothetical protein